MSRARPSVVGALLAVSAALAAGPARIGGGGVAAADVRRPGSVSPAPRGERGGGLEFRLSEGTEPGEAPALVARPTAERLPDAEARRVLDRLPPLAALPREEPFAIREASLPPPRAGRSVRAAFPPADEARDARTPRRRARSRSCGACPRATCRSRRTSRSPSRSRWSRSTRTRASRARRSRSGSPRSRPASGAGWARGRSSSSPRAASRWRRTTASRSRRARARRPAGRWRAPRAGRSRRPRRGSWPATRSGGPARRDTLMLAVFDQRVDPAAVLASLRVRAGGADLPVRLATAAEVRGGRDRRAARGGSASPAASSPSGPSARCPPTRRSP